jgi:hypothetical protein
VTSSGDKLSPAIRKPMTQSLLSLISHVEDSSRLAASGCLAALIKWLPEEERSPILTETVLDDSKSKLEARAVALKYCLVTLFLSILMPGSLRKKILQKKKKKNTICRF